MTDITPITEKERADFAVLEHDIEAGFETFIDIGNKLNEISVRRLYRENFATFGEYCEKRWKMSKSFAYRQIAASEVAANVQQAGLPAPQSERSVRPLTPLPPTEQVEVYTEAVEKSDGQAPATETVQAVVEEHKARVSPVGDKTFGFSGEEIEGDKQLKDALGVLTKLTSSDFTKAITLGTVPFTRKDVIRMADMMDSKEIQNLSELILARRWTLNRAIAFSNTMIDEGTNVTELILHAIANGGAVEATINGWKVSVGRAVNGRKYTIK